MSQEICVPGLTTQYFRALGFGLPINGNATHSQCLEEMFSVVPGYPKRDLCDIAFRTLRTLREKREPAGVAEIPALDSASEPALVFAVIP